MPGVDTTFLISGHVKNSAGVALANRPVKVILGYHEFDNGVSVESDPTSGQTTDGMGNYFFSWHVASYDSTFGFSVVTKSNDLQAFLTTTAGQYEGFPTGNPANIDVSDTVLDPNPNPGGG